MPGFPVFHHLPELAQTHVHQVSDAIQQSHPLSSPSPPAFNLFQHLGSFLMSWLFASDGQSIGASDSASVLPMNIQDWFPLGLTGLISLQSNGFSDPFPSVVLGCLTCVWSAPPPCPALPHQLGQSMENSHQPGRRALLQGNFKDNIICRQDSEQELHKLLSSWPKLGKRAKSV